MNDERRKICLKYPKEIKEVVLTLIQHSKIDPEFKNYGYQLPNGRFVNEGVNAMSFLKDYQTEFGLPS